VLSYCHCVTTASLDGGRRQLLQHSLVTLSTTSDLSSSSSSSSSLLSLSLERYITTIAPTVVTINGPSQRLYTLLLLTTEPFYASNNFISKVACGQVLFLLAWLPLYSSFIQIYEDSRRYFVSVFANFAPRFYCACTETAAFLLRF